jgi:hypothetical protein
MFVSTMAVLYGIYLPIYHYLLHLCSWAPWPCYMVYICLSIIICYTYVRENHGRVIWYISTYLSLSVTPTFVSTMAMLYGLYLPIYHFLLHLYSWAPWPCYMVYIYLSIIICYTYPREHPGRVIWYISASLSLSVTPMFVSTMAVLYGIYLPIYQHGHGAHEHRCNR